MRKWFYTRLAFSNMVKNRRTFVPYMLTAIFTVAMFFMMISLTLDKGLNALPAGADYIRIILSMGLVIVGIFAAIFLFYTHSFVIKRRKKEIGLFNILGMEKKHLSKLMLIETLITASVSIVLGILTGMLFSRLMALLLCKVLGTEQTFSLSFTVLSFIPTIALFFGIFFLTFLHSLWQVHLSKPVELLKGGNVGEKEPKNKWVLTILGLITLGIGYSLSLTVENPVTALTSFFLAVILVIIGTYLLFTAGSITLLKALKKNRNYYYKTNHFISVSGMLYRMKQNAVGLANICILSTMVLVMMSTTTALIAGLDEAVAQRYPSEFNLQASFETQEDIARMDGIIQTHLAAANGTMTNQWSMRQIGLAEAKENEVYRYYVLAQEDFTRETGLGQPLKDGEAMVFSEAIRYEESTIQLGGYVFTVKEASKTPALEAKFNAFVSLNPNVYLVVKDTATVLEMAHGLNINPTYNLRFDTNLSSKEQIGLEKELRKEKLGFWECRASGGVEVQGMYAGFFFLGLFLGLLFLMATVLILYYKQISEGYDDKDRFTIMQNVGLSHNEVRKAIHSQTLMLFFLPLITAFVHLLFAYPMIRKIMLLMNMPESAPFMDFTLATCGLFAIFYLIVYLLTARTYGKIVTEQSK